MTVDSIVLHRLVDHYSRYLATSAGRDKALRVIQYFSRFYAWYLRRNNSPPQAVLPWATVKIQLSLSRKIMALGKFLEHLRAALEHFDRAPKPEDAGKTVQYLQAVRQLGYTGLLLCDNIYVVNAMELGTVANVKKIQRIGNLFWFISLAASVFSGLHTWLQVRARAATLHDKDAKAEIESAQIIRQTRLQLAADLCDAVGASSALGWIGFNDGVVGLTGMMSGLLGMRNVWTKTALRQ